MMEEFSALLIEGAPDDCRNFVPFIAVSADLSTNWISLYFLPAARVAPKVFLLRMLLLTTPDCNLQGLKNVVKLPKECRQMSTADHDVDLRHVPKRLLLLSQNVRVHLKSRRL